MLESEDAAGPGRTGTVQRVTDGSHYTVAFHDGDERTLRRGAVTLMGPAHFQEGGTLGSFPLGDPDTVAAAAAAATVGPPHTPTPLSFLSPLLCPRPLPSVSLSPCLPANPLPLHLPDFLLLASRRCFPASPLPDLPASLPAVAVRRVCRPIPHACIRA